VAPIVCKCCGHVCDPFASVDFSRTCADRTAPVFAPTGEAVTYCRCRACGFLFTSHFDHLSDEQMIEKIYNREYAMADPDFLGSRPHHFARELQEQLAPLRGDLVALDFGGGSGLLAELMRVAGFADFDSYDPFFANNAAPSRTYDLITAFEVVEHARDAIEPFRQMLSLLRPDGTLLFSTMLQPRHVDANWWYMAPRNGHVSLHSRRSLHTIALRLGLGFLSIDAGTHLFYRSRLSPGTRSIVRPLAGRMLRFASLQGIGSFTMAAWQLAFLGQARAALEPRHAARAVLRQFVPGTE
jgi:2-polyprenyl-6-hydroxyphenyl methylase/3-demethylubiquinone-9 3-methyltransferase